MKKKLLALLLGLLGVTTLLFTSGVLAAKPPKGLWGTPFDVLHVGPDVSGLPVVGEAASRQANSTFRTAQTPPAVGDVRVWLALEDTFGAFYFKRFQLRAIGDHVEIWTAFGSRTVAGTTATDLNFQDGDCRNGVRTTVTDAQVAYLAGQFDNNILPKESVAFSIAPDRDGSGGFHGATSQGTADPTGEGDNTVVLVDNVRDDNFHDFSNTQGFPYIAGFFSSQLNDFFDRNIMTIDGFDWLHRTGANPPNDPVPGNNCTSAPARPFLYEGVFAHEYQHLLEHYVDGDEVNWINEGLSDWAQTLTGYVNPSISIQNTGFDSHIQSFLGWIGVSTPANPNPRAGGPENSLTRWEDQGSGEILADYGAAYSMMEMLAGRYGQSFMSSLHRGDANGLPGLQQALGGVSSKLLSQNVVHDWSLMAALDGLLDAGAKTEGTVKEKDVTTPTLHATINWDTTDAYSTPGAPSNGSDYVRLRDGSGNYLSGGQIKSLGFKGSSTLPTLPVQWTVDPNPPTHAGDPALYSGAGNNRDEAIIRQITVPTGSPNLTFEAFWNEEEGWDFGFVQISTDGGATYQSLSCTDTTSEHNPDALPTAVENVPGFTGFSGTFKPETCSLAAYAGQTVLLAFRAFNDPAVLGADGSAPPGFWVDDVMVNSTLISDGTSLVGWKSFTETRPNTVSGFTVTLVSVAGSKITVKHLPLHGDFSVVGSANVQRYIDKKATLVSAIVFYDDPTETSTQYAPYRLTVNGVTQPGGGL
jgi:hypothetical protein